jgi:probable F420-dependent oxidoreductase
MQLGTFGTWTTFHAIGEEHGAAAAKLVEDLGYGTFWLGSSPRLASMRPLLEATERIVIATSIVNIWAYEPGQLATEHADLARDFSDRLLVGIGVGHPEATSDYTHPLRAMRAFLDGLDAADPPLPREHRCLAALAPQMLALSAERSLGAIPYLVPVSHTSAARALLGDGPLLAPEHAFELDEDVERARATARTFAASYLGRSNYTRNLLRLGFTDQDIADGGSDRLIDAVIAQGSADQIAGVAQDHLAAGADHVVVQALGESGIPRRSWTALAHALLG